MILEEIFNSFSFLWNLFSNEFLLCPGATVQVSSRFIYSKQEVPKGVHVSRHLSRPLVYMHDAEDVLLQDVIFVVFFQPLYYQF